MSDDTQRHVICIERVLKHEGGFVDHPNDPGGATNKGITIGTARSVFGNQYTVESLKNISLRAVYSIYKDRYWDVCRAGELPVGLDYCHFDASVNSGPGRAAKWLQDTVGVTRDGSIGPKTLDAMPQTAYGIDAAIRNYCESRMGFLRDLSTWGSFGKGWTRRVNGVRSNAIADARDTSPAPGKEALHTITVYTDGSIKVEDAA